MILFLAQNMCQNNNMHGIKYDEFSEISFFREITSTNKNFSKDNIHLLTFIIHRM